MTMEIAWIAADWGTSHVRLWAMSAADTVLDSRESAAGMGTLSPDDFEPTLRELAAAWTLPTPCPMIACGMVGAKQGWCDAGYRQIGEPTNLRWQRAPSGADWEVSILSGLSQAEPPDVMRGEETQIAGHLADHPDFTGLLCLPGTHSKWVRLVDGNIREFSTFMTGELFGLLAEQSILRHSMASEQANPQPSQPTNAGQASAEAVPDPAFEAAVIAASTFPAHFSADLFRLRATDLLDAPNPSARRAQLSGYCIGLEMASLQTSGWFSSADSMVIIGAAEISHRYCAAWQVVFPDFPADQCQLISGEQAVLAGLTAAYHHIKKERA